MSTRRELLRGLAAVPWLGTAIGSGRRRGVEAVQAGMQMRVEDHLLARESAAGFDLLRGSINNTTSHPLVVMPAVRELSLGEGLAVARAVKEGAWLFFESGVCFSDERVVDQQRRVMGEGFGLRVMPLQKIQAHAGAAYVLYHWPECARVRHFEGFTPVVGEGVEPIARFGSQTVCARKKLGRGGIIYLGSMLGPGLFAEEREAHLVGRALLRSLLPE